jgi:hypothetical protein
VEKTDMQNMQNMLAYTIRSSMYGGSGSPPRVVVGQGSNSTWMSPQQPQDDSYWIVILNAKNPREKVKEWIVPGRNNTTIPSGLDTYMSDPNNLFAITTQILSTLHVPQGSLYSYFVKYGAGRELQKLEQINAALSCGIYSTMSYILTGQCGPRGGNIIPPASYEVATYAQIPQDPALLLMSLMPMPNGGPPWSICDCNTFMSMSAKSTAPKSSAQASTAKKGSAKASSAGKSSAKSKKGGASKK